MAVVRRVARVIGWLAIGLGRVSPNFRFLLPPRFPRSQLRRAASDPARKKILRFSSLNGGRDRDRTCDPYDVNVVLFR